MAASLTDITKAVTLAWELHQLGWAEDLRADRQYRELGNDIRFLAENLQHILDVVENAQINWKQQALRARGPRGISRQKEWDLADLDQIIGDYQITLVDCRKLLDENPEFKRDRGAVHNVDWNIRIQPKVEQLRRRIQLHNTKIGIVLKPLELNLLTDVHQGLADIHRDLSDRIDVVHQSVLRLQGLLIQDLEQALENKDDVTIPVKVPETIATRFQTAAERVHPDVRSRDYFPLQAGADALLCHFQESTTLFTGGRFLADRTPPAGQYLQLLKCIWMIERLLGSRELLDLPKDSQWHGYVGQLREELHTESLRFQGSSMQTLIAPEIPPSLKEEAYKIWDEEDIKELMAPRFDTYMEEVLKVPLPSERHSMAREMTFYRINASTYRLVETIGDRDQRTRRSSSYELDLNLKTIEFAPIYATPSSREKAYELQLHAGSTQYNPTFQELKHIYRIQHLLTGYKVYDRYDQSMVKVVFQVSGQTIEEHGRIQLWLPQTFESYCTASSNSSQHTITPNQQQTSPRSPPFPSSSQSNQFPSAGRDIASASQSSIASSLASMNGPYRNNINHSAARSPPPPTSPLRSTAMLPDVSKRYSASTQSSTMSNFSANLNRGLRRVGSAISTSSRASRSTTASSVTTIRTGTSSSGLGMGRARLHAKPLKPLLVIFLKSKDAAAKLALVAIEVDEYAAVERERCKCRSATSACRISCVEREKGDLVAMRWETDPAEGLKGWDLGKLGVERRGEGKGTRWENVRRVTFTFKSMEERYSFAGGPCSCNPKTIHELSRCNMEGHNGKFGIVKQIGGQRLRNYHDERDSAGKNTLVMGTLPEDECH